MQGDGVPTVETNASRRRNLLEGQTMATRKAGAVVEDGAERLSDSDFGWLAERIHEHRELRRRHPDWAARIEWSIDNLLWSASVDGRVGAIVRQDGWVRSGQALTDVDFGNAPSTKLARDAFRRGQLKEIKREHVVPRAALLQIVLNTSSVVDTRRVIKAYAFVALVHDNECKRLKPRSRMPAGWDAGVDWARPPELLPDPWLRYQRADPPVVLQHHGGRPAYE